MVVPGGAITQATALGGGHILASLYAGAPSQRIHPAKRGQRLRHGAAILRAQAKDTGLATQRQQEQQSLAATHSADKTHEGQAAAPQMQEAVEEEKKEEAWTLQQFLSIISGILGGFLSALAFQNQRAATRESQAKKLTQAIAKVPPKNARIVQQLGGALLDAEAQAPLFSLGPMPTCTEDSNLRRDGRHFTIITTASLPWLTGTAVNPLLRALYLAKRGTNTILVVPWLEQEDQKIVFPSGQIFNTREEQELVIHKWCKERANMDIAKLPISIRWYQAHYVQSVASVFPSGDCSTELGDGPKDVLILEEPEHLCWYHHGQRWPTLFKHVVGVVHTNYQDYLVQHKSKRSDTFGWTKADMVPDNWKEQFVFTASNVVCSAYCDVNIKLSDTIMPLPNEVTCNVHGVRAEFLQIGDTMAERKHKPDDVKVYYLGKALYAKGWDELLMLFEKDACNSKLQGLKIHGFGSGPDQDKIRERAEALSDKGISFKMHPGTDHAGEAIHGYSVLVNPSTSDVLCTVTVEALAMGKRCVLAMHPSNNFFEQYFPDRCYFFSANNVDSFIDAMKAATSAGPPTPLPPQQRYILTWEAAIDRLFDAAEVRVLSGQKQRPSEAAVSELAYKLHNSMLGDSTMAEVIREATLGDPDTPWAEYLDEWRRSWLEPLRDQAAKPGTKSS